MHPYILRAVAAERIKDLQNEARAARLAREARRRRAPAPGTTRAGAPRQLPQPAADPPLSCAEFLARTAGPLMCEPSAAERAHGQAVR